MPLLDKAQIRNKLIVALDVPRAAAATEAAAKLRGHVGAFKVGLELFSAEGPAMVRQLTSAGDKIFLDLKFNDIPNTVRGAAREAARLGASMFTIHANGGRKMMQAAVEGAQEGAASAGKARPVVLAVTVLTSLAAENLAEIGLEGSPAEAAVRLAKLAQSAGADGVVTSPKEIAAIRGACGSELLIVTPGIRPASSESKPDDQARIATPLAAIQAGADYLVVGRPILQASSPAAAAETILDQIEKALVTSSA